jgi:hypothetical protein
MPNIIEFTLAALFLRVSPLLNCAGHLKFNDGKGMASTKMKGTNSPELVPFIFVSTS